MSGGRGFAIVLAVAAVACVGGAFLTGTAESSSNVDGAAATPLWSARRVPQPIVDAVGAQRLQAALDQSIAGQNACFVVSEGGAPLAEHAPDMSLVPASTQKIATAAAILAVLGPETRLETRAVAVDPVHEGTVDRLILVGGGDPLLVTPDVQALREQRPELRGTPTTSLATLADAIVAAGVRRIPQGIGADDTRYETLRYLPTWDTDYRTEGQVGPLGALTVNGGFSSLQPKPIAVADPAVFAADKLGELLEARGVTIGRPPSREQAPEGAVDIAKVQSPPMVDIIAEDLSASDNLSSELLAREVGFRLSHEGTTAAGMRAITAKLAELGLPMNNVTFVDSSGLDKNNRATCALLASALDLGERPEYSVLWNGLAVAGESGTLIDQITGSLKGKVRGKTGTVDDASGLVGIVDLGRPIRFAFLANGPLTEQAAIELRSRIATIIAAFPDAPPADTLVPQPSSASDS